MSKDFKKQARSLQARAKELEIKVSYQQSLELVASLQGFKTWNALEASLKKEAPQVKLKSDFLYYDLSYFYDRKNSGSFYVKISRADFEKELQEIKDEDSAILNLAVKTNQIDSSEIRSISEVCEITEEEYNEWQ